MASALDLKRPLFEVHDRSYGVAYGMVNEPHIVYGTTTEVHYHAGRKKPYRVDLWRNHRKVECNTFSREEAVAARVRFLTKKENVHEYRVLYIHEPAEPPTQEPV